VLLRPATDIVEIKHIMLPPSSRDFKDIFVVFELMETDLHQVIKANDDLTAEHYQFFLYQMLRGLKYIHSGASVYMDLNLLFLQSSFTICGRPMVIQLTHPP
jgi:serine/threonine protein kinase